MYKKIYDFNQVRNKFKYDKDLEIKMYTEEVREFFEAVSLAERIDAYCDCDYVFKGTQMKMAVSGLSTAPYINQDYVMYDILRSEVDGFVSPAGSNVPNCNGRGKLDIILHKAMKIVCECNELKLNQLDEDGKVSKQADLPNATELIAEMIERVMKED